MSANKSTESLSILLFEDNKHDADLVEDYLDMTGIKPKLKQVSRLKDGLKALNAPKASYDVVLLDLSLPDCRGLETLEAVVESSPEIPVIILTGSADEALSLKAVKSGAQDYLAKDGLNADTLRRTIRYSVERSKLLKRSESHAAETKRREGLLQKIFDANTEAMLILSKQFEIRSLNPAAARLLDSDQKALIGETFPFHFKHGETSEIEIPISNGDHRMIELNSSDLDWEGDSAQLLVLRDITELRLISRQYKSDKSRAARIFNIVSDAIFLTDKTGIIVKLNKSAETLTGKKANEAIGKHFAEIATLIDSNGSQLLRDFADLSLKNAAPALPTDPSILLERTDAPPSLVSIHLSPVAIDGTETSGLMIALNPLTAGKQSEEESYRAERLHSISLLAGGIAHDFNNMLSAILGNLSVVLHGLPEKDGNLEKLEAAEKAALQAKRLTQQLLTFSKGGNPILEATTIDQVVQDCAEFILRGSNVKCSVEKKPNVWAVKADKGQIAQVINNLLINADQAMPDGGMIEIKVINTRIKRHEISALTPGDYVKIAIKDSGIGIDPADIHHIFDPYFTTKQSGNGLGLASSYSIIQRHSGLLTVESKPGKGALFEIYLPRTSKSKVEETQETEEKNVIHHGSGRILVMDDMEDMMRVAGEIISMLGYDVEFSADGEEAIKAYTEAMEKETPFDAVVFDLTVPGGMGGEEACKRLKELDPNIKAIASSGYSTSNIMSDHRDSPFSEVVPKPYRIKEMSIALHRLLG